MIYSKQMQRRLATGVALSLTVGMWAGIAPPSLGETSAPQVLAQADSFSDIGGHLYQAEILRAASLGFIAGPGDGTFRPNNTVTREQAVSIILSATGVTDNQLVGIPNPFRDVPSNRWSASKIAYAANNNIVAGRGPGVFDPTATVTRAELMAMLKNVADTTFAGRTSGATTAFSDTAGHWANDTITYLTGYCGVATPLNERGTGFAPNVGATRAFTAAAIVRLHDCGGTPATANTTPTQTTPTQTTTAAQPVSSYESFSITPGFVPDPATGSGISGGGDPVPNACGFGGDINLSGAPDHILTVEQPFNYLRINVSSDADVSFVMQNAQNGVFTCVDDSDGTLLPKFEGALAAGDYYIWVGDFAPNTGFPYEIAITEFAPTAPTTSTNSAFAQELLTAHNQYRTAVGATALTWSPALTTTAQQWADQLAANGGSLAHSDRSQRNGAGENLAAGGPPSAYSLTDLVDLWGAEQQFFISGLPFPAVSITGNWADVGHYTQIIWRNTTEVGCGVAIGGGQEILVCHYNPSGNVTGQRP